MGLLDDKTAIIAEGGEGIGFEIAGTFAREGQRWWCPPSTSRRPARRQKSCRGAGATAIALRCDVASEQEVDGLVRTGTAEPGSLDIMVNNAGITRTPLCAR